MLILSRKPDERILIGDNISIMVISCSDRSVRLGIDAPDNVAVDREEIRRLKEEENGRGHVML